MTTSMLWLHQIEALKAGDPCEFRWPARMTWRKAEVVRNGGSGYWEVRVSEPYTDEENGERVAAGTIASAIYIEHVRLPGQKQAWS
jgi:hypothetical protein